MATRTRLLTALALVAVLVATGIWYVSTRPNWVRVTSVDRLATQEVVFESELKMYVVDTPDGPIAVSAKVPHERTDYVRYCRSSELFESHFLAAKFDRYGIYYGGPGSRSLDRIESKVEDGIVYVNPDEITRGFARGEREARGPQGPFCSPT